MATNDDNQRALRVAKVFSNRIACIAAVGVMFVLLSTLNYGGAPRSFMTGPLVEFKAGRWLIVDSEQAGRRRAVALADSTPYEGPDRRLLDPILLEPGIRVQVSYRLAGDAHPIDERVRVLAPRESPHLR